MDAELIHEIIEIAKRYKVTKLILFGSALESFPAAADIDLACDGLYDKSFFRFGAEIEALLGKSVDLLPLSPSDRLTEYIINHGKVVYESKVA